MVDFGTVFNFVIFALLAFFHSLHKCCIFLADQGINLTYVNINYAIYMLPASWNSNSWILLNLIFYLLNCSRMSV